MYSNHVKKLAIAPRNIIIVYNFYGRDKKKSSKIVNVILQYRIFANPIFIQPPVLSLPS